MIPQEAKSSLKVGTVLGWLCHWVPFNLFFFFFHPGFQNSLAARPHGLCSRGLCCVEWGLAPVKLFQAAETAHWQGEGAWWRHTRELIKDSKRVRQPQEKVQRSMIICGFWTPGSSPGSEQKTIAYWPQHLAARNTVLQPTGEIFQTFSDFCSCSVSQVTSPFLTFYFYYTLKHYRRMKKI